ncbi:MAG: DUF805 domain-containing protein [Hyphomonas sp.]|nr:DUF805 domain-containing protein [Hyphomonas sp.]
MELYFSPNGRISQGTYWRGVITLFVISAVLSAVAAYVSPFIGFLGIIFIWPWIALHVKRFHDAGKTGWLTLAMVVLAFIVSFVVGMLLMGAFGVDAASMQQEMMEDMESMQSSGDPGAVMAYAMEQSKKMAQKQLIPNLLSSGIVTAAIGFVMSLFKSDPADNQYGPPAA